MTQLSANFQYGLSAIVGTAAQSKSFAYDEAQYVYSYGVCLSIGPFAGTMGTSTIGNGGEGVAYVTSFTQKQLRSITAAKWGTGSGADLVGVTLCSAFAQAFGTATGAAQFATGVGTGTFYNTSTLQGTGVNVVQLLNGSATGLMFFGTGQAGVSGTGSWNGGTAAPTSQVIQFPGGTFTVVVANNQGTNSQTGYVFPVGPNGGLTVNPGDILIVSKSATDTQNAYAIELEFSYTPGAYVTR